MLVPATIANRAPSLMTSTAADVAARAARILSGGKSIDPEQSTMMISALPSALSCAGGAPSVGSASAVTVTTALTSRPPTGRYGFWSICTVNPGRLVIAHSSVKSPATQAGTA